MKEVLNTAAEVHFTFGQVELQIFSQQNFSRLEPDEYSLEQLIDELMIREFRLVDVRKYCSTPAITGTVSFRFRPPTEQEKGTCSCLDLAPLKLIRGPLGESWKVRMGTVPAEGDETPNRTILRIHLMPLSDEVRDGAREQDRSCELAVAQTTA